MKILVLSLLRLGDIIQQAPLFKGLREKYPHAEIHLLLNKQFSSVEKILDGVVDKYIYFDRDALQKGLGEANYNILWSYTEVERLIQTLNKENYNAAYNFTHNKLSAYLLGALQIPQKNGLYQEEGRFKGLTNPWLRYFNDRFSGTQKSLFHYVELLGNAFALPTKATTAPHVKSKSKLVLLQCLTSDSKKNWGLEKFAELKRTIEISLVDYEVCVLGASFERETLAAVFSERDLLICDLPEARKHLQNAALLVTGDTSIKHLAAQVGTPIVEIAIGSSDSTKTAAYSAKALILNSDVACAPCSHSQACPQASHLCAEDVSVEKVFGAVWDQLSGEKIAQKNHIRVLERAVWSLYLHNESEPSYREALQNIFEQLSQKEISSCLSAWNEHGTLLLNWFNRAKAALPSREELAGKKNFQSSDIADLILCAQDILKTKRDEAGYFQNFVESLLTRFSHPVQIYDRVSAALTEAEALLNIRSSFTQYLQTSSTEGAYYAKGIGQLPISGFEETGKSVQRNLENAEL
ncbi:glycosyltransferase family 9 protein [Bdellovibrio bacteriovorus]|uniref:glycosyltransferase family 9 protein n=1 Tax=Bdellovibrio bacteriovorus TaxID=959 RepID=UPI0035A60E9F